MEERIFIIGRRAEHRTVFERVSAMMMAFSMIGIQFVPLVAWADESYGTDMSGQEQMRSESSNSESDKVADMGKSDTNEEDEKVAEPGDTKETDQPTVNDSAPVTDAASQVVASGNDIVVRTCDDGMELEDTGKCITETLTDETTGQQGERPVVDEISGDASKVTDPEMGTGVAEAVPGTDPQTGAALERSSDSDVTGDDIVTVDTGDATATAAAVTVVNANVTGDVGLQIENVPERTDQNVNLLEDFLERTRAVETADDVSFPIGGGGGLSVENVNTAVVMTDVTANADSGNNIMTGSEGDASIGTGNASAIAAAVNLVNLNLVGFGSLFAVINNFGDWTGDIVVPGEGLLSFGDGGSVPTSVRNDSEASVTNDISASANSGGNAISGVGDDASITTGDAFAVADSKTIVNTNIIGSGWFLFILNNYGNWTGSVVDGDPLVSGIYGFLFGDSGKQVSVCGKPDCSDIAVVANRNRAVLVNTVSASANTGDNTISGADGDAGITTGDATATAGAFNLVNTNIVGNDWLMGVFNNFGTWRGNLVFAYPDLVVSVDDGRDTVSPGESVTYHVTLKNKGLAAAEHVGIDADFPDGISGDIHVPETLGPGETYSFDVSGSVADHATGTYLVASVSADTGTTERHTENNSATDSDSVVLADGGNVTRFHDDSGDSDDAKLSISRTQDGDGSIVSGESLITHITVRNGGDLPIGDIVVRDRFSGPDGNEIGYYSWPIGGLNPGEGVLIEYSFAPAAGSAPGTYGVSAQAKGNADGDGHEEVKSRRAEAAFRLFGAYAIAEEPGGEDLSRPEIAESAEASPQTLGVSAETAAALPVWILFLSGVAYFLAVNWSYFPNVKRHGKY